MLCFCYSRFMFGYLFLVHLVISLSFRLRLDESCCLRLRLSRLADFGSFLLCFFLLLLYLFCSSCFFFFFFLMFSGGMVFGVFFFFNLFVFVREIMRWFLFGDFLF